MRCCTSIPGETSAALLLPLQHGQILRCAAGHAGTPAASPGFTASLLPSPVAAVLGQKSWKGSRHSSGNYNITLHTFFGEIIHYLRKKGSYFRKAKPRARGQRNPADSPNFLQPERLRNEVVLLLSPFRFLHFSFGVQNCTYLQRHCRTPCRIILTPQTYGEHSFHLLCRKSKADRIPQTSHREKFFSRYFKFKKIVIMGEIIIAVYI